MRIRATVAAVSGALALSAFAVPSALAADSGASHKADAVKILQAVAHPASGKQAFGTAAVGEPAPLNATFSDFKIAKAVKVGISSHVSTTVTYTMTHGADVDITSENFVTGPFLYRGDINFPDNMLFGDLPATCTPISPTVAACKGKIDIYPGEGELLNSDAGTWKGAAVAVQLSDAGQLTALARQGDLATTLVQRYSKLTVNASPEPVKKGATITVTGKLTRANWETNTYAGYANQYVKLQYRKAGTSTYTTLKTIKSDSTGYLKTTTTATVDGYFRYSFAGTTTTPAVNSTADFVDVQ
jgi:hypothetical protein